MFDTSRYLYEDHDQALYQANKVQRPDAQKLRLRAKSITPLKFDTTLLKLKQREKLLNRRSIDPTTLSLDAQLSSRKENSKDRFIKSVNVVKAALRFSKQKDKSKEAEPEDEQPPSPRISSTRNPILAQPSPLKRAGVTWEKLARMGANRISLLKDQEEGTPIPDIANTVVRVAKVMRSTRRRFKRKGDALKCFQKATRRILVVLKWKSVLEEESKTMESELKTFMDLAQEFEESSTIKSIEEKSGLSFDPRKFKANRSIQLSEETKRTLTSPAESRNEESLQKAQNELQRMKAFAEYPLHMQERLSRVAWYQQLEPRRLILREGHYAENFYFILSGQAMVKKMITNKNSVPQLTTLGRLKDGQCFGEVALLHRSQRTASIESATYLHLLLIARDDFFSIFLNTMNGGEPQHITYCRTLPFFKHWPVDNLLKTKDGCMFHFFRRGCVVVADSKYDNWIYIVKTGSCAVLKKLTAVEPKKTWIRRVVPEVVKLPRLTTHSSAKTDSNYPKEIQQPVPETLERTMTAFFETQKEIESDTSRDRNTSESSHSMPRRSSLNSLKLGPNNAKLMRTQSGNGMNLNELPKVENANKRRDIPRFRRRASSARKHTQVLNFRSTIQEVTNEPADANPCFIQLRKLVPGEIFGLENVEFDNEDTTPTSVIMVSNGAELVMISKSLFRQHANELTKKYHRETVRRYPQDNILQHNLQTEVNWKLYREQLVTDFCVQHQLLASVD